MNDHYRPQLIQQSSRLKGVRYTALHVAAYKANASVCRLLINSNADVAAKDYKSLRAVVRLQKCQLTPRFAEDARRFSSVMYTNFVAVVAHLNTDGCGRRRLLRLLGSKCTYFLRFFYLLFTARYWLLSFGGPG